MNDFPPPREMVGPAQIQTMQQDIEWLKDKVRAQEPRPSSTVQPEQQSNGTVFNVLPTAPPVSTAGSLPTWLP